MNLHPAVLRCSLLAVSLLGLFIPSACGQPRPRVTEAVDEAQRVTLQGNVHPLARAEFDRGAVAESQPLKRILLLLKRSDEQEAALQTTLQNLQDKSSPLYHQWLTPQQFGTQFGPADADIQAVTDWLTRQGFTVEKAYSGKTVVEFSGTVGQVQKAFGTAIHSYQVNGKTYSANASDPQIPAALAPVVTGVVSLHNFPRQYYARRVGTMRRTEGKSLFEPDTTFPNPFGSGNFYGLGPGDFAKIYNTPATCGTPSATCNGAGQTIAVVGETNINVADVQNFRKAFGLPANFDETSIIYNGEDPGITSSDEEGEADLDTQWSGAVAPGAKVKYVLSASTTASQGVDLSALYIVEHNFAGAMSESYGACENSLGSSENSFFNSLWQQASAQGITVVVSAGDNGSAGCDNFNTETKALLGPAVSGIASTPYNVAVGGTDFDEFSRWSTFWSATNNTATGTSALGYIPEVPWNESCAQQSSGGCNTNSQLLNIVAGSGGPSTKYGKPSWQMGTTGVPTDNKRDLPDIAVFASPGFNGTGYLYCQSDVAGDFCTADFSFPSVSFGVVGGTSASAPAFAGIMAIVNQSQSTPQNPAPRQGNANYILYALANKVGASCASSMTEAPGCVFNDITNGSSALPVGGTGIGTNSVPCKGATPGCSATAGTSIGVLDDPNNPGKRAWLTTAGYDLVTGLGSLNIGNLTAKWGSVSTIATSTSLTLNPTTGITHGTENVTATITVTPSSGTASGIVSLVAKLADGTTASAGQFTLGSNGNVSATVENLPGGTNYQVYAHYSGDGTNAPSDSAPVSVTIAQEGSETFLVIPTFDPHTGNQTSANATTVNYGSLYIIRMYVTNSAGTAGTSGPPTGACTQSSKVTCPSGTVKLTADGNLVDVGTYNLDDIGYTRDLVPTVGGGTHALSAAYSGDTSYQPSTGTVTFTVNPAVTSLGPAYDTGYPLVGQPTQIGVSLVSQAGTGIAPTGTITFYDGNNPLPSPVTFTGTAPGYYGNGSATAFITPTFATPGSHAITAKYSGDANYAAASTNGSTPVSVVYPTSMSINVSSSTLNFGQSLTLTFVLTGQGKTPPITGQFTLQGPGSAYSNVTTVAGTDGSGNQTLTLTATTIPQASGYYYALYPGDANYASAVSPQDYVTVNIPDFSLQPANGLSVVPMAGQAGSASMTITPLSQIASTVSLYLSSSPTIIAGYTLGLSPSQVSLNGSAATAMLTLTPNNSGTTAVRPQARKAGLFDVSSGSLWRMGLALCLGLFLVVGGPARRKKLRTALALGTICLLYCVLGCGGGGGGTGGGGGGGGGGSQQKPTSIALTTTSAKAPQGGSYTVTATVTGSGTLTGTVSFFDYGVLVAGPVYIGNGTATMGSGELDGIGVHQITATYNGDASNLSSSSTALTQTITGTLAIGIEGNTGIDSHSVAATIGIQ